MKSINNLLLLGDGESWARQKIDFAGLPEMVRTFLQVAAGAAGIPVTRLLGQSPAGLSATGDSDTRNYYDMIAARQEVDLRPQLERLDRLLLRSAGVELEAVSFAFRPLWQMDAKDRAAIALEKAKATQVYAGLKLWPDATLARLVEAQLVEEATYPNAEAVFGEMTGQGAAQVRPSDPQGTADAFPVPSGSAAYLTQPRDPDGRWAAEAGGGQAASNSTPSTPHIIEVAGTDPPLKRIHPDSTYETDLEAKRSLEHWRNQSTDDIVKSLKDHPREFLKVKPDGRIFNGNTRIRILQERGYPVDSLPRTPVGNPFNELGGGGGRIPPYKPIEE